MSGGRMQGIPKNKVGQNDAIIYVPVSGAVCRLCVLVCVGYYRKMSTVCLSRSLLLGQGPYVAMCCHVALLP